MKSKQAGFLSIDEYIAAQSEAIRPKLQEMREIIKAAAPEAKEKISYQMPAFELKGNLVYYAAWAKHIGFYPGSGEIVRMFEDELSSYERTKGTIQFPFDQPLPTELITKIVQLRVMENVTNAEQKARKKKSGG
jgi:uncharacterized protein YdhG (YjbR/CyaY superfamily)